MATSKRSHAAASMYYFSYWILICGLSLMLVPKLLLNLIGITMTNSATGGPNYILGHLFGMVLVFLAFYYQMVSRREEMREFYRWTTYTRFLALPGTAVFVFLGLGEPITLLFVVVDFLGALWTTLALRKDELERLKAA